MENEAVLKRATHVYCIRSFFKTYENLENLKEKYVQRMIVYFERYQRFEDDHKILNINLPTSN